MRMVSDWRDRAAMLIAAIDDLDLPNPPPRGSAGSSRHHALFRRYVGELREAVELAEAWWENLIDVEEERTGDRDEAVENVLERHPAGPVSHKPLIGVLRLHWLACSELNEKAAPAERVSPPELLLSWLAREDQDDLAAFLADLPYWPIGLNSHGRWI